MNCGRHRIRARPGASRKWCPGKIKDLGLSKSHSDSKWPEILIIEPVLDAANSALESPLLPYDGYAPFVRFATNGGNDDGCPRRHRTRPRRATAERANRPGSERHGKTSLASDEATQPSSGVDRLANSHAGDL